jgi:hypothetical protein
MMGKLIDTKDLPDHILEQLRRVKDDVAKAMMGNPTGVNLTVLSMLLAEELHSAFPGLESSLDELHRLSAMMGINLARWAVEDAGSDGEGVSRIITIRDLPDGDRLETLLDE